MRITVTTTPTPSSPSPCTWGAFVAEDVARLGRIAAMPHAEGTWGGGMQSPRHPDTIILR
jgi:hypothetical protein